MRSAGNIGLSVSGGGHFNTLKDCYLAAMRDFQSHMLKAAPRLLNRIKRNTPVDTGLLRRSYTTNYELHSPESTYNTNAPFYEFNLFNHCPYSAFQEVAPYARHFAELGFLRFVLRGMK